MQQRLHNMHALNTWHALSKPPLAGEVRDVWQEPDLHNPTFLAVAALSGFIGFAIRWVPRCCAGGILVAKLCRQGLPWGMSPACTLRRFRRRQQDPPPPPPFLPCSFTSLWFLSSTTPSIYSLVGSLNKIPLAVIGLLVR